ncbi:tyrosine-type recombinase/integrase [Cupriavidus pampae]|uniref:Tyrosine recombinase XerC n=1 Tax=Cupriavidus pampae TaxID=659251 RepID=A0ABN7ZJH2_9BURK|nr:tyrosine-type recombinase/integrase [Cupriavidus pampae]CAG9185628.1 Tyrosine recombinase XerC [Cupriavidus pampae]
MDTLWLVDPARAYADWQQREASGADQRPFSERSIVQHRAMFDRFYRHLIRHGATLSSFGPELLDGFWLNKDVADHSPATRMRYLKLVDRLCRQLMHAGVRTTNPAAELVLRAQWPHDDPPLHFLPKSVDLRLQAFVQPVADDDLAEARCRAIVAMYLGTGVTAREGRHALMQDLHPRGRAPYLHVPAKGPRIARTVPLESFAIAPLSHWLRVRGKLPVEGELLFTLRQRGTPVTDMSLGNIVRMAFDAVGYTAAEMGPQILRNTYSRRLLIRGVTPAEVSLRLGLTSRRTVDRICATLPRRRSE